MAGYSTLFSLGMMAQHASEQFAHRTSSPTLPSMTSRPTTPTNGLMPPKITINTQVSPARPTLRKRRSSLTVAVSPMSGVKSPSRSAGLSFNKAILMSPTSRARHAHSMTMSAMSEGTHESFTSRMRSGSLGGLPIRTRRAGLVRKQSAPPPSGPLPAPPTFELSPFSPGPTTAPPIMSASVPHFYTTQPTPTSTSFRAPPLRRILTDSSLNTYQDYSSAAALDSALLSPDFASKLVYAMTTPPSSAMHSPVGYEGHNALWSPLEMDEAMKEN